MVMVNYTDGYGGLLRWTWWTTEMDMVDYTDGHGGLHRWTWWTTQMDMVDYTNEHGGLHTMFICVVHHVHLCSPPCPSV
jgi:uncharacterized membrane protein YhfC